MCRHCRRAYKQRKHDSPSAVHTRGALGRQWHLPLLAPACAAAGPAAGKGVPQALIGSSRRRACIWTAGRLYRRLHRGMARWRNAWEKARRIPQPATGRRCNPQAHKRPCLALPGASEITDEDRTRGWLAPCRRDDGVSRPPTEAKRRRVSRCFGDCCRRPGALDRPGQRRLGSRSVLAHAEIPESKPVVPRGFWSARGTALRNDASVASEPGSPPPPAPWTAHNAPSRVREWGSCPVFVFENRKRCPAAFGIQQQGLHPPVLLILGRNMYRV